MTAAAYDPTRVIRCVRCWTPLSDADRVVRVPFAATSQPSVAHSDDCPIPQTPEPTGPVGSTSTAATAGATTP